MFNTALFHYLKYILTQSADRTYPVIRDVFKGSARRDAAVRITHLRIINIAARAALIFFHLKFLHSGKPMPIYSRIPISAMPHIPAMSFQKSHLIPNSSP